MPLGDFFHQLLSHLLAIVDVLLDYVVECEDFESSACSCFDSLRVIVNTCCLEDLLELLLRHQLLIVLVV